MAKTVRDGKYVSFLEFVLDVPAFAPALTVLLYFTYSNVITVSVQALNCATFDNQDVLLQDVRV